LRQSFSALPATLARAEAFQALLLEAPNTSDRPRVPSVPLRGVLVLTMIYFPDINSICRSSMDGVVQRVQSFAKESTPRILAVLLNRSEL